MAAAKRLQVSSSFDARYPAFDPRVAATVLPVFWAEELVTIQRADADAFKRGAYAVRLIAAPCDATIRQVCAVACAGVVGAEPRAPAGLGCASPPPQLARVGPLGDAAPDCCIPRAAAAALAHALTHCTSAARPARCTAT